MKDQATLVKVEQIPNGDFTMTAEHLNALRRLACTPGAIDLFLNYVNRMPMLDRCTSEMAALTVKCDSLEMMCKQYVCPGNNNYSQRTLDEYSDDNQINLVEVVKGLGGNYVDAFPVPPGKQIKLTHKGRPGYSPSKIAVDLNVAAGGNNYLDFVLQFYLVPGGTNNTEGLPVGSEMRGNQFLNKDGTQIHVAFPQYRNRPIDVGSLETLALVIKNTGGANNLDSAFVTIYYDNHQFYELCKAKCGGC